MQIVRSPARQGLVLTARVGLGDMAAASVIRFASFGPPHVPAPSAVSIKHNWRRASMFRPPKKHCTCERINGMPKAGPTFCGAPCEHPARCRRGKPCATGIQLASPITFLPGGALYERLPGAGVPREHRLLFADIVRRTPPRDGSRPAIR